SPNDEGNGEASGFNGAMMTAYKRDMAREAFELWDDLIAINLTENSATSGSIITMAYSSNTEDGGTYARTWTTGPDPTHGIDKSRIWLADDWTSLNNDADIQYSKFGFTTYLHEIGHSLGLSHSGSYNAGPGETITYADDAEYAQDTRKYTIMSYFGGWENHSGVWEFVNDGETNAKYASTPMIHDIAAIQAKYGADMTTRTGNTMYGFGSNAGRDVYDFNINTNPILTIWDAGGTDTINASGFSQNQVINLNDGTYSSIGALKDNVGIAYDAIIENAYGGSGNDQIYGNGVDNLLKGGGGADGLYGLDGNDTLVGADGNDTLKGGGGADSLFGGNDRDFLVGEGNNDAIDGGNGIDTASFSAARSAYTLTGIAGGGVTVTGPDGTDTITHVEKLQFSDMTLKLPKVDFNGDFFSDMLLRCDDGRVGLWQLNGPAVIWGGTVATLDTSWDIIDTGDFGGNGHADILLHNDDGRVGIWEMGAQSAAWTGTITTLDPSWQIIDAADFNGDGKSDILGRNAADGRVGLWEMNGHAVAWAGTIATIDTSWHIAETADFNADGKADLLMRCD
ncbi:MAG: matrixin family metalloprotease, partial [Bauldia sp.]